MLIHSRAAVVASLALKSSRHAAVSPRPSTSFLRLFCTSLPAMAVQRVQVASADQAPRSGSLKEYTFAGEGDDAVKVLVSNVDGKLYATSAKCTHYGAPLANGILTSKGKIVCPWHGACFDAKTGDIEEAPALDNLLTFKVDTDDNGNVFVEADADKLKGKPGSAISCRGEVASQEPGLVIVGGGSAAINAIESARKEGYSGKITLLTAEKHAPIDRTKLSKGLIGSPDPVIWRSAAHLRNVLKVDLKEGVQVDSVDVEAKKVQAQDGSSVPFDTLLLATGSTAKRLPVPGAKEGELQNVFAVRQVADMHSILQAIGDKKDKDVVIIGTSFIGMELAIALNGQEKAKSISVVGMESVAFENILGKEVGAGLQKAQEQKGIKFYNKAGVEKVEGKDGKASAVAIKDASGKHVSLPADVVVCGVGAAPATGFLKSSKGFPELLKDGSIAVDKHLRVKGVPQDAKVYACGDIATVPARTQDGATVRIEHWNVAGNHGRAVGKSVAGKSDDPFDVLPIFWSALGAQLRYVSDGNPPGSDETYVDGKPEELKFAAYYAKQGKVTAVVTVGRDPLMVQSAELIRTGKMPSLAEIKGGKDPLSVPLANL